MGFEIKNNADEPDWRQSLRNAVRSLGELAALLELPAGSLGDSAAAESFPLLVPREFVARMRKGDPDDPLLRQVLPATAETLAQPGFVADPLRELDFASHGSLQKYPGRALLITTGACPVHCRYCFRREFPYAAQNAGRDNWQPALAALAARPPIGELILSGGDPLSLGNEQLRRLLGQIAATLPAVQTLRIHTRFPVVLPARVDRGLIDLLAAAPFAVVVVLHANHPAEIDHDVGIATTQLKAVSSALLNQSVLLRGINDDAATLIALGQRLLAANVLPYYLHLLDRVVGSAHFDVDETAARGIIESIRRQAPGYLVPRLVREQPGELCKSPVT